MDYLGHSILTLSGGGDSAAIVVLQAEVNTLRQRVDDEEKTVAGLTHLQ